MSFKIAFIGAGSLVFARTLFTDIMSVPELHDIEVAFTDINPDNLEKTRELCQRDLDANNIQLKLKQQLIVVTHLKMPAISSTAFVSVDLKDLKQMWKFH